jgi:hypothetical protein
MTLTLRGRSARLRLEQARSDGTLRTVAESTLTTV